MWRFIAICILLISCKESLQSQWCWSTFNSDTCAINIVTEFGISRRFSKSFVKREAANYLDVDANLGVSKNINSKIAVGGHFFFNGALRDRGEYIQFGFRPRISYYPDDRKELNFAFGVIFHNSLSDLVNIPGYSMETGISWKNDIGIYTRIDLLNLSEGTSSQVFNLGIKTTGKMGRILAVLGGAAAGVGVIVIISSL